MDNKISLRQAVQEENTEAVRLLLGEGADIHQKDAQGYTPLHHSANLSSSMEIMRLLLEAGASVDDKDNEGKTPLHLASYYGAKKAVKMLVNAGANVNEKQIDGNTPLHLVAFSYNKGILKLLIDSGAGVNFRRADGKTPLHLAVLFENKKISKILVNAGASVDDRDGKGYTALHLAVLSQDKKIVGLLLNAGADVNARDNEGYTVLQFANTGRKSRCNFKITRMLIEAGADLNEKSVGSNRTALHLAAEKNDVSMVKYLLARGADINSSDADNQTPLHLAVRSDRAGSHSKLIKKLLENKADASAPDNEGTTPLQYLLNENNTEILDFISNRCNHRDGAKAEDRWDKLEQKFSEMKVVVESKISRLEEKDGRFLSPKYMFFVIIVICFTIQFFLMRHSDGDSVCCNKLPTLPSV